MEPRLNVRAEALAKILLIQSFAGSLPGKRRMMEFVCSGLHELPGVAQARFEDHLPKTEEKKEASTSIALLTGDHHHGHIVLTLADEELFEPYRPYAQNLGFTLAVSLEERRKRKIIEDHRRNLEKRVEEKTQAWIREVRKREEAQKQAQKIQQRADKLESLGILAGGIAHDFNNLLGGIFGFIELALDASSNNPEVVTYLERSLSAYERAKEITQQLLTFSKGGTLHKKVTSIRSLLERGCFLASKNLNCACELRLPEDLWPCEVDEQQMARVIENIVLNAAQAMPQGGAVTIEAENTDGQALPHLPTKHERYVKISVTDRGAGISEEILPQIFDPFFTTKPGAHGLGLAICHSIVKRHQGVLIAASKPGVGTSMHIHLPASPEINLDIEHARF